MLFPLEVDRVIFVDSDQVISECNIDFWDRSGLNLAFLSVQQIVRTDLKALVDLDMEGAPYAYPPMCNDRNETKVFSFFFFPLWFLLMNSSLDLT